MPPMSKMDLSDLKDDELLKMRICELPIRLEDGLQAQIDFLYMELKQKGILFRPVCYLADEWFVPTDATCIAIPFYLSHSRLIQLEKKMMLEAEGEKPEAFKKLLRHETGHALYYAFNLKNNKKLTSVFGPPSEETPNTYRPKPYSRNFVRHLPNWYAQCDPDEDFAETFAVWLDPLSDWKKNYTGWKAVKKLNLIDEIMSEIKGQQPSINNDKACDARKLKSTLEHYYQKKKKESIEEYPEFYDPDLMKIFSNDSSFVSNEKADRWMKKNQKILLNKIAFWTGDKKYNCDQLLKKLMERCRVLELHLCKSEAESLMDVTAYLTSMMTNHLLTGKYKRTV